MTSEENRHLSELTQGELRKMSPEQLVTPWLHPPPTLKCSGPHGRPIRAVSLGESVFVCEDAPFSFLTLITLRLACQQH